MSGASGGGNRNLFSIEEAQAELGRSDAYSLALDTNNMIAIRGGALRFYHLALQYCLVKLLGVSLLTFPQRHAREFVDDLLIRLPCFHFPCCSDIFSPWAKPGLVLQWYQVRV
jgi:hypothetical protein